MNQNNTYPFNLNLHITKHPLSAVFVPCYLPVCKTLRATNNRSEQSASADMRYFAWDTQTAFSNSEIYAEKYLKSNISKFLKIIITKHLVNLTLFLDHFQSLLQKGIDQEHNFFQTSHILGQVFQWQHDIYAQFKTKLHRRVCKVSRVYTCTARQVSL